MIWESCYWKDPILRMAKRLAAAKSATKLSQRRFVQIEKDIFLGFYSIRKLLDCTAKVTDKARASDVVLISYPNIAPVHWRNWFEYHKLYDLEHGHKMTRNLRFVTNQFIHSFIFTIIESQSGGLEGTFITSDQEKDKRLYSIQTDELIRVFELIGNDYPTRIEWTKDQDTCEEILLVE